jgi:copper chaperone CopZ
VSLERLCAEVSTRGSLAALLRAAAATGYAASVVGAAPAACADAFAYAEGESRCLAEAQSRRVLLLRAASVHSGGAAAAAAAAAAGEAAAPTLLRVRRMACGACVGTVERAARRVPGVLSVSASLLAGTAAVTWRSPRPARCGTADDVAAAVRAAGYSCDVVDASAARHATFRVQGLCCAACPARIAAVLRATPGVGTVAVEPEACRVSVSYDGAAVGPRALRDALLGLGYGAEPWAQDGGGEGGDAAADTAAEVAEWCVPGAWLDARGCVCVCVRCCMRMRCVC